MGNDGDHPREPDPDIGEGIWDDGIRAAFSPASEMRDLDEESILEAISRVSGSQPRVLLRDDLEADHSPVLKALARSGPERIENDRRYQMLGEIARGGVGIVYKSRDRDLGRDVALKVLLPDHADNPDVVNRFVEEAQVEGQLQRPNIVPVYGLGMQPDGRPYFVMKLVKGQTLSARLQGRDDPGRDRLVYLSIFEHVCQALAYAHARGVIHRDLKPANVMTGAFGEVQVMDWGFAKVMGRDEKISRAAPQPMATIIATVRSAEDGSQSIAGSVMGTPAYMPPEQALGRVEELDERSDVFSLGAILCEILTGLPPYTGEMADVLVMAAQCRQEEAHERLGTCGAGEALVSLVKRCLAPMRDERPEHAGVVGEEIHRHLDEVEESARRAETEEAEESARQKEQDAHLARERLRVEKFKARVVEEKAEAERERNQTARANRRARAERRTRWGVVAAAAVLLLAVGLGGYGWLRHGREKRARVREISEKATAALRKATEHEGRKEWSQAFEMVRTARDLADKSDETTRLRAGEVFARIEDARAAADARAETDRQDEAFLAKLDAIWLQRTAIRGFGDRGDEESGEPRIGGGLTGVARFDADLTRAFREHGLDLETLEPEAAAERIRASRYRVEIASTLDEWSFLQRALTELAGKKDWRHLVRVARLADPDEWRNRLRDAAASEDPDALYALADSAPMDDLHPRTLGFLGQSLARWGTDLERNLDFLSKAHRRYPRDFWICVELATVHGWAGRREESVRLLGVALALRPGSEDLSLLQIEYLARLGDFDRARAICRDVLSHSSRKHLYHAGLALIAERRRDIDEARRQWALWMGSAPPNDVTGHIAIGNTYWTRRRDYPTAVKWYRRALVRNSDSHEANARLAGALKQHSGDPEDGMEELRIAIQKAPRCVNCRYELAIRLVKLGRFQDAEQVADEMARDRPEAYKSRVLRPWILLANGDPGARPALEAIAKEYEESAQIRLWLAEHFKGKSDWEDALAHVRAALHLAPWRDQWRSLSQHYRAMGYMKRALAAVDEALRLGVFRTDHRAAAIRASMLRELGEVDKADAACSQALNQEPGLVAGHQVMAMIRFDQGRSDDAHREVDEAIRLNLRAPRLLPLRAFLLMNRGRFRAAIEDLEDRLEREKHWPRTTTYCGTVRERKEWDSLLRRCRAFLKLEDHYPAIQAGKFPAEKPEQGVTLGGLCRVKRWYEEGVTYFRAALADDPSLAEEPVARYRYEAAICAVRAAEARPTDTAAELRTEALTWLRADLSDMRERFENGDIVAQISVRHTLWRTRRSHDLASVRKGGIDALPEAERAAWRAFWKDLETFLAHTLERED